MIINQISIIHQLHTIESCFKKEKKRYIYHQKHQWWGKQLKSIHPLIKQLRNNENTFIQWRKMAIFFQLIIFILATEKYSTLKEEYIKIEIFSCKYRFWWSSPNVVLAFNQLIKKHICSIKYIVFICFTYETVIVLPPLSIFITAMRWVMATSPWTIMINNCI